MKYKNANSILPEELIEVIQQYVQGEYIYIPIRDKIEKTTLTEYEVELQKRDEHIYTKALEGASNKNLSKVYNLSESSIRRIIINQRKRYRNMEDKIRDILDKWELNNETITQIYDSAWQIGEAYILKVYENTDKLERNIKINIILDNKGIPVGRIIFTKENTTFAKDDRHYYIMAEKLPGSNLVSIRDNLGIATEMGRIIADLHIAFKACETQEEFWNNCLLDEMNGWIKSTLNSDGWKYISEEKFNTTVIHLTEVYAKLPVQLIHRDVHFGNFLFDEGKFSGYVDFDLSQRNIRIFDLCYFMLGLLSEEEKMNVTYAEWFEILENVFTGYQQTIKLCEEEKLAVPYVMKSIELLFVAWFIKQEDLKCAENAMKIFEFVDANEKIIISRLSSR